MLRYSFTFVDIIIASSLASLLVHVLGRSEMKQFAADVVKCFIFWLVGTLRICIMAFRRMLELLDMCDDQR
jgi:uncharacterized membrane protein YjjP (DUF1212 family)